MNDMEGMNLALELARKGCGFVKSQSNGWCCAGKGGKSNRLGIP